jgi:ABC-type branched-subunit amino acid transport system substrate-binding protein
MNENEFDDFFQSLTLQEKEVLKLFLQGHSDPEIAVALSITEGTTRAHFSHIKKRVTIVGGYFDRNVLISCFIKYKGAWVANCVRERWGYPKWEDPDSNRNIERSSSNFYLEKIKNCTDNEQVIKLYENAIKADHSDPYAQIYFNNANARLQGNTLKIGVVVAKAGNDFHEFASTQVLRGIADAQTQFNESGGKDRRLLEIEIRNDGNRPFDAKETAKKFANDLSVLAILGHHSSESTQAALSIYEAKSIAVISPTSTSSELRSKIFFRTIGSTKIVANKYANYIKQCLGLDKIVVAYHRNNEFSEILKSDFEKAFNALGGEIINIDSTVDINADSLSIENLVSDAKRVSKALLVISSIETNSVAIAIATENSKLQSKKLQLLLTTSLPEIPLLEKGGTAIEGAVLVSPCLVEKSDYMKKAQERWGQQKINWRVATSYDATQAVIEAIRLSEVPTREEILKKLKTIKLSSSETSGFGLEWSNDRANVHSKYCIFKIRQHDFEEIIEK